MILTRSPLRISLGGGGTDLPSYYRKYEGALIAAAIDKYVYIALHDSFTPNTILKYSKIENVTAVGQVQNPLIRESLKLTGMGDRYLEVVSMADVPSGTGLGSSGSFSCALLKALHAYKKETVKPNEIAEEACRIEIDILGNHVGKQDQYASAYGGINCYTFKKDDTVEIAPLRLSDDTRYALEDNLLLFFTGFSHNASDVLKEQDTRSKEDDRAMADNLNFTKELGYKSKTALENGDLAGFAELMNVHWEHKKQRSGGMSNENINKWYELARKNGALGGKLVGAGGGGFLMFYADDAAKLRGAMRHEGLQEVRFRFDFQGSAVVTQS